MSYTSKNLNFEWSNRKADVGFGRIGDLTEADRTALALDIRRQFEPDAAEKDVKAPEKAQLGSEPGLSRSRMALSGRARQAERVRVESVQHRGR